MNNLERLINTALMKLEQETREQTEKNQAILANQVMNELPKLVEIAVSKIMAETLMRYNQEIAQMRQQAGLQLTAMQEMTDRANKTAGDLQELYRQGLDLMANVELDIITADKVSTTLMPYLEKLEKLLEELETSEQEKMTREGSITQDLERKAENLNKQQQETQKMLEMLQEQSNSLQGIIMGLQEFLGG